ncbi:Bug family tripartite tricarboxylate transporter substrate binding protein [Falsiroseomonas sp.]|uniref:Bug family tripartite tricarboxylate transporter substrate binding protein n=1 Tax=Falsiroseomonas sp. TaxID=2870721 RepID=UPI003F7061B8
MPLACGALSRPGLAQGGAAGEAWPSRPIRLVVAWAPGGAVHTIARRLPPKLAVSLGRPVVVIAVHRHAPWPDLAALIAAAKREPERITYGTGGSGSAPYFATAAFAQAAGTRMLHLPFRGAGEAVTNVLSRQVDAVMVSLDLALGHVQGGTLRVLAISGAQRAPVLPQVATFKGAERPGPRRGWQHLLHRPGTDRPARPDRPHPARAPGIGLDAA